MTWPTASLEEIARSVDYGLTASASDRPDGPKFLRITDIQNDQVDWNTVPYCVADKKAATSNRLEPGDIVFARTGATTGKSFLIRQCPADSVFASYLIRVRPGPKVDPIFLAQFFRSAGYWEQINSAARGAAQPGVNATVLKGLAVPLPPLDEQRRIAAILDQADELRRKRRQAISSLASLISSRFRTLFGDPISNPRRWPVSLLGDVGELERGVSTHRPRNDPLLLGGKHPLIQTGDVANAGGVVKIFSSTYSDMGLKQSRMWPRGTLCITIAANIGKSAVLNFDACFPDSVVGFSPGKGITATYVQYWMGSIQQRLEAAAPESAQKNINLAILRALPIPVPPLALQERFEGIVGAIRQLVRLQRDHEAGLSEMFSSLQHRAFNGEL